jgi:hypothetical protein
MSLGWPEMILNIFKYANILQLITKYGREEDF